ncbi:peptide ABC transporter permease [Verrucomicrobia bacterium LW23]|nr:peptide ABC transporter permease [Verrucomicrobia bacterium LW23]
MNHSAASSSSSLYQGEFSSYGVKEAPPSLIRWSGGACLRASAFVASLRLGVILAGIFVALLFVAAISPELLVATDPLATNAREVFRAPSLAHPFGTDENGRDLLARLVHGVRPSLIMGLGATLIGLGGGALIGLLAGLGRRWIDGAIMRALDVVLAFPDILLALVIITFCGQGMANAIFAVGVASIPRYARMVRAQTLVVRQSQYIEAARTLGLHPLVIVWRHVLPNAIKPVLILATIGIGGKIAAGAALSFLGFGAPPPAPEWGSMLSVGRNFLANAWWLTAIPGVAITLTVLSISAIGREIMRRSEGKRV